MRQAVGRTLGKIRQTGRDAAGMGHLSDEFDIFLETIRSLKEC